MLKMKIEAKGSSSTKRLLLILYAVAAVDLLASSMIFTLLGMYLKEEVMLSPTISGLIMSIYGLTQFFSSPLAGAESDVRGYKTILSATMVALGPVYALLCVGVWPVILISRFAGGLLKHTQNLCKSAAGAYLPPSEQLKVFGNINAMGNIGFVVGPAIAGHLTLVIGYKGVFICAGTLFVLIGLFVTIVFPNEDLLRQEVSPISKKSGHKSVIEDLTSINWTKQWDLFTIRFLFGFASLIFRSNSHYLWTARYSLNNVSMGYMQSYQSLISFISSLSVHFLSSRFPSITACFIFFQGLAVISLIGLIFLSSSFALFLVSLTAFNMSRAILRPTSYELTAMRCEPSEIGLIFGAVASSVSVARAVSPAAGGLLHQLDPDLPALVALGACLVGFLISLTATKNVKSVYSVKSSYLDEKKTD